MQKNQHWPFSRLYMEEEDDDDECFHTFCVNEPFSWGCVRRRQLLFNLGYVLGVKVVEQTLTYQVILERKGGEETKHKQSGPNEICTGKQL